MHEIEALADLCSVFRNGRHIETFVKGARTDDQIVELMIGREYTQVFPAKPKRTEAPPKVLDVEHLSWGEQLSDISLSAAVSLTSLRVTGRANSDTARTSTMNQVGVAGSESAS